VTAEIITVGEELLLGSTINTNAAWLGDRLDRLGFRTRRSVTVGDDHDAIVSAVGSALESASLTVVTGGLGPTHDDITKHAIADLFGLELVIDPVVEDDLRSRFAQRGRPFTEGRRSMAYVPAGFEALKNPVGMAPGLLYVRSGDRKVGLLILPGVPSEMKGLVTTYGDNIASRLTAGVARIHRTFLTAGITENRLEEAVKDLIESRHEDVRFALLPDARTGVRLRITVDSGDAETARAHMDRVAAAAEERLGDLVYGYDDDQLEVVVGTLLRERGLSLALAESCTGGLIADRITDVPGSSDYFKGGVIAYGNEIKEGFLNVRPETLATHGAVSKQVALEMAIGCRIRMSADVGVSATGIAGPGGGSVEKPVGTVYLGLSSSEHELAIHLKLTENRQLNKLLTSTMALNLIRRHVLKLPV